MSAPAAPSKAPPGPIAPPEEQFWDKYSPHYEFPLSGVGSVLMNVGALAVFLIALWFMARSTASDKTSLPISTKEVSFGEAAGAGAAGSGGGTPEEAADPVVPTEPSQPVPEPKLKDVSKEVEKWVPNIPNAPDAPRVEDLPAVKNLAKMNDEIRKLLRPGDGGGTGAGKEPGKGATDTPGAGANAKGDASSGTNRSLRWTIDFERSSPAEYLKQLAACKAVLAFPYPDKSLRVFRDPGAATPVSEPFKKEDLPGIYFVDADRAYEVAQELGVPIRRPDPKKRDDKGEPAYFICFFPKAIEEDLAAKERAYRGRKESEIFSTTFSLVIRDGKPDIRVTAQEPVRR